MQYSQTTEEHIVSPELRLLVVVIYHVSAENEIQSLQEEQVLLTRIHFFSPLNYLLIYEQFFGVN